MSSRASNGPPSLRLRPVTVITVIVVLALFITGLVIGGPVGAVIIGVLTLAAGVLLAARWPVMDPKIRLFRLAVVLICVAVTVTVAVRG